MRYVFTSLTTFFLSFLVIAADKPSDKPIRKIDFDVGDRVCRASGKVLAVTKTSILIDEERKKGPTTYFFHDRLAAGTVQKGRIGESCTYLVSDVQVGDLICLGLITENKQIFCVDISICERPGGLIPPSQIVDKDRPWYQWQNAQIAFRDKGTPIPEHLKPAVMTVPVEKKDPLKK